MTRVHTAFFAVGLAALPFAALAQSPPPLPKPAPEMAQLKVFDGSWTCEGKMPATPMGPAGTMKGTVKSQTDLGGFWQSGKVTSTMAGMPTMEGMFHMTWDPGAKQYVLLWVDNMGGWAQSTSKGWEGDTITFAGDSYMGGQKIPSRDTFTKAADGTLKHIAEMQMDGKMTLSMDETCRKAAR